MNEYTARTHASAVRIAGSHGYRIEGDVAFLNAELDVANDGTDVGEWALQLWACPEPYTGGQLSGVKIAETPLCLDDRGGLKLVAGEAIARVPAVKGEYSMVLVVASRADEQVHDFSNFPARESFVGPHLDGAVGYSIDGDSVVLRAERVQNPRPAFTLSGALTLELWALRAVHAGGELDGVCVASAELGSIGGQFFLDAQEHRVPLAAPSEGEWHMAVVLRERTAAAGAVTRDFCSFPATFTVEPKSEPSPAEGADATPALETAAEELPSNEADRPSSRPLFPKVSIQTATLEALMQVKGISKKIAAEIIRSRPFQSLDDLLHVRGIGEKLLRKLRPYLTL